MPVHSTLQVVIVFGVALLGGCVGAPQTFHAARPVVPGRPAALRMVSRPPPPAAPTLSASEKRRLFREFQQSQGADEAAADRELAP